MPSPLAQTWYTIFWLSENAISSYIFEALRRLFGGPNNVRASVPGNESQYVLSRGYSANIRQNLQYYLWKDQGFTLHPSIPTNIEGIRVAEIGVATGIWLLDLARNLPPSAHIDGFDIDLSQCPPKEWLPSNVSVHIRDCIAPFPKELIGTYDIVHIQPFHLGVQNNNPDPIVKNLISLLKPGGWISWGEYDYNTWEVVHTTAAKNHEKDHLTELLNYMGTIGETKPSWVWNFWPMNLPHTFKSAGLVDINLDRRPFLKEMMLFQLDTALMASEELTFNALDPLGRGRGEKGRELIRKCFEERDEKAFNVGRLTVVGKLPG